MPTSANWRRNPRVWLALAGTLVLWSSAFAGIRAAMRLTPAGLPGPDGYGPGEVALLRFATASLVLALFALITRMRMPGWKDLPGIAVAGVVGISIYHVSLNYGEQTVSSGAAALLISAGPVFVALLSMVFLRERLTWIGWLGIGVAFAGVALISVSQSGGLRFSAGAAFVLASALATAAYFILTKRLLRNHTPIEFTCYSIWAGTIPLLIFLPGLVRQAPAAAPSATLAIVYLGVFPAALAYVLSNYALSRMPASLMTTFLYLSPVLAALIAWFWLAEVPSTLTVVGGAIAILGVIIVQTKGQHQQEATTA